MKQFKDDVLHWKDYDFTVINNKIENCYKSIINFLNYQNGKKVTLKYNKVFTLKHINKLLK